MLFWKYTRFGSSTVKLFLERNSKPLSKKITKRILLSAGVILSLLFAFDVKTHVVYATTTDDDVAVDDDPAPVEDDDDDVTTNDDDDNEENNNNDEEETITQAEEGEAVANGVKITNTNNDNEKNTVNYVVAAGDDQIEKNASTQAKTLAKHPSVIEDEPMTDYTLSDRNHYWVPYWYWYTVINNQPTSSMPKKHPTNVKTSTHNVKKYQRYVSRKANHKSLRTVIIMVASIIFFIVFLGVMFNLFA